MKVMQVTRTVDVKKVAVAAGEYGPQIKCGRTSTEALANASRLAGGLNETEAEALKAELRVRGFQF